MILIENDQKTGKKQTEGIFSLSEYSNSQPDRYFDNRTFILPTAKKTNRLAKRFFGLLNFVGRLKMCGLLIFFLNFISLMTGHAAIMQCAIFVRSAKIMRSAKFFFSA